MAHEEQSENAHLEGDESDQVTDLDLATVRAEYRARFGKQPFHGWTMEELQHKILLANAGVAPDARPKDAAPERPAEPTVRVVLFCDHVYLPEDLTLPNWENAPTRRYDGTTDGRRTKLDVHPSLAAFLQDRKQAETLD